MTELDFCKDFAYNLAREIEMSGYSHYEVAERSYLDESTLNKLLKGYRTPSVRTVVNLSLTLECDITDLISYEDYIN